VGLIVTSHAFVLAEGKAVHSQVGVHDDGLIPSLAEMTQAVHEAGGKIALQLAHGGLWSIAAGAEAGAACTPQPPGPSVRQTDTGPAGREMKWPRSPASHGRLPPPPSGRGGQGSTPCRSTRPTAIC